MRKAKVLRFLMYMHLLASIAAPFMAVFFANKYKAASGWLIILIYVILIFSIQIYGWFCSVNARKLLKQGNISELREAWLLLKLKTIPFYILNYIYSFLIWFVIVAASRGIFIIFAWIPFAVTCSFIIQSGIYGYCYLKHVRDEHIMDVNNKQLIIQFVPVLDIFGTLKLRKLC